MRTFFVLAALILATHLFAAEDPPVKIVTFETKEGRKFQALSYSSFNSGEFKTYILTTLDGKKAMLLEKDLASRTEAITPLAELKEDARKEVLKARAAAAAAKAESEARAAEQRVILVAKNAENQARSVYNKARESLAAADGLLANAEAIVKNAPIEMAKAEARYDGAKTELSTPAVPLYGGLASPRRSDYLREQMKQAAEDKARIEAGKKEAEEVLARTHENIRILEARVAAAKKDLAAAEAETKKAIEKTRAPRERAENDLTIRINPDVAAGAK